MYARVVRFTDVDPERIKQIDERSQDDGPPEGVEMKKLQMIYDESQGTAVVVQLFDSEDAMKKSAEIMSQMDVSETPGTRESVDQGEIKMEFEA